MSENDRAEQLVKLKSRIPYDEDIFDSESDYDVALGELLDDSLYIALETLFPFEPDFENMQLPKKYYNWQIRCCLELYALADKAGITNYTENSISWSKLSDGLSNSLMNKLTSRAKAPYSESSEE